MRKLEDPCMTLSLHDLGGIRQLVEPVAQALAIPLDRVYANVLLVHEISRE